MAIYLPSTAEEEHVALDELTPREIVAELDKHVVGQNAAKRAVAIALRNRMRRQKLPPDLAEEVIPKNIIMIGPTGVGKTEIARRLARMSNSPFLKVEASKFTEVGYVGRDVESMIRDLTEISIEITRQEKSEEVAEKAELNVEERILDLLLPPPRSNAGSRSSSFSKSNASLSDPSPSGTCTFALQCRSSETSNDSTPGIRAASCAGSIPVSRRKCWTEIICRQLSTFSPSGTNCAILIEPSCGPPVNARWKPRGVTRTIPSACAHATVACVNRLNSARARNNARAGIRA
jgi:hypothetical protein